MARKSKSNTGGNATKDRPKKSRHETNYECLATVQFKGLDNRLRGCAEDIKALTNDVRTIKIIMERWNRQRTILEPLRGTMDNETNTSTPPPAQPDPHTITEKAASPASTIPSSQVPGQRSNVKRVRKPQTSIANNAMPATNDRSLPMTTREPALKHVGQSPSRLPSNSARVRRDGSQPGPTRSANHRTIPVDAQEDRSADEASSGPDSIPGVVRETANQTGFPIVNNTLIVPVRESAEFTDTINAYRRMEALADAVEVTGGESASGSEMSEEEQDQGIQERMPDPFVVHPTWLPTMPQIIRDIFGEDILRRFATTALCFGAWDQLVNLPTGIGSRGRFASFFFLSALFTMSRYAELDRWSTTFPPAEQMPRVQQEMALLWAWVLTAVVAGGITLQWHWWTS